MTQDETDDIHSEIIARMEGFENVERPVLSLVILSLVSSLLEGLDDDLGREKYMELFIDTIKEHLAHANMTWAAFVREKADEQLAKNVERKDMH
jgi:hypothetical protein